MQEHQGRPMRPAELIAFLGEHGIDCPTVSHAPLMTVADSRRHREVHAGAYTKNLFVRNKRGRMWLLTLLEDREIVLKETAKAIGAGNLSFASRERLWRHLGIEPGAVSPLALVNDREREVEFLIDPGILVHGTIHLHPLDNTMTTTLTREGFLRFLATLGREPKPLPVGDGGAPGS